MTFKVGLDEIAIWDQHDQHSFPALVFYPTQDQPQTIMLGPFRFEAAERAALAEGIFPLVIISHGAGGSHYTHRNLARYLAQNGLIVCIPEHPFNNRNDNQRHDTIENLIDRPRHLSLAIDHMLEASRWKEHLEAEQVFLIGHSMGAYTALALSGGIADTSHQIAHDPHTKISRAQIIAVTPHAAIKALVLFAPAAGWFLSEGALQAVKVPILLYSAERDRITPHIHAEIIAKGIADQALFQHRIVANADHYSFLSSYPARMVRAKLPPALDPEGFDREAFHQVLHAEVLEFFACLKKVAPV